MFLTSKRFWKRVGIGFAIFVGLLLVANGIAAWWASARLESRLAKLRAAGEPTSIAELAPKPIPPEEDAAAYLESIRDEVEAFHKDYGKFFNTPLGKDWEERLDQDLLPTPEQAAAMRKILQRYPTIMPTVGRAVACEQYASKLDFSLDHEQFLEQVFDRTSRFRGLARYLHWQMLILVAEENFEEAVHTGIDLLHLARLYDAEPTLVNGLMAIAVRGIAVDRLNQTLRTGPISPEMRESLDQELNCHDEPEWLVRVMKTEKPISLLSLRSPVQRERGVPVLMAWVVKIWQAVMLDGWERLMPLFRNVRHERAEQIENLFDYSKSRSVANTMMVLLEPALVMAVHADNRTTALIRSLRILNALQAYRDTHAREASGLDDLEVPKSATIDPFDGKPLKLKWTDDGWVIYSVGANGVGDGGDFKGMAADVGLGPIGYTGPE